MRKLNGSVFTDVMYMRRELSRSRDRVSSSTVRILVDPLTPPLLPLPLAMPRADGRFSEPGPGEISPALAPDPLSSPPCAVSVTELSPGDVCCCCCCFWLLPLVDVANWEAAMVSRLRAADCVSSCSFLICCWKK